MSCVHKFFFVDLYCASRISDVPLHISLARSRWPPLDTSEPLFQPLKSTYRSRMMNEKKGCSFPSKSQTHQKVTLSSYHPAISSSNTFVSMCSLADSNSRQNSLETRGQGVSRSLLFGFDLKRNTNP